MDRTIKVPVELKAPQDLVKGDIVVIEKDNKVFYKIVDYVIYNKTNDSVAVNFFVDCNSEKRDVQFEYFFSRNAIFSVLMQ